MINTTVATTARARIRPGRLSAEDTLLRNQRILRVARALFVQHGLRGTTFDEIARQAHVTKRTLYLQFKNKENLFSQVLMNSVQETNDSIQLLIPEGTDLLSAVASLAEQFYTAMDRPDALILYQIVVGESRHLDIDLAKPGTEQGAKSAMAIAMRHFQSVEAQGKVTFLNLPLFAELFLQMVLAPVFYRWVLGSKFNTIDTVDNQPRMLELFLKATADLYQLP